uniref:Uncharacterized protein n=1 Tax=Arundo donax TaxID=35708 RepID=A0A0A9ER43_ARUDO
MVFCHFFSCLKVMLMIKNFLLFDSHCKPTNLYISWVWHYKYMLLNIRNSFIIDIEV